MIMADEAAPDVSAKVHQPCGKDRPWKSMAVADGTHHKSMDVDSQVKSMSKGVTDITPGMDCSWSY